MAALSFRNGKLVKRQTAAITSCEGCPGACCQYQGRPPLSASEEAVLPDAVKVELAAFDEAVARGERPPSGIKLREIAAGRVGLTMFADGRLVDPCLWLDSTGQCKNYEYRPETCRVFEVGGKDCRTTRAEFRIPLPTLSG